MKKDGGIRDGRVEGKVRVKNGNGCDRVWAPTDSVGRSGM